MLEDAERSYKRAISIKPDYVEATLNKAMLSIRQNEINDSIKYLEKVIEISTDDLSLMAIVKLAVLNFQAYELNSSRLLIEKSKKILQRENALIKHDLNYHIYLSKLISWHMTNSAPIDNYKGQWIHVIGESHALASNRLFIKNFNNGALCQTYWINGCKQWHLGNSSSNQYKQQFERVFHSIPCGSTILLSIGEIDCRIDDGILKHIKKYPSTNLSALIESTIENYLTYVYNVTIIKSNHVVIQGVPCPNIDPLSIGSNDLSILINLISQFNYELGVKSKKLGFEFLDLHTLTDRGDGYSNGIWHIDGYHLSPAGMIEAWKRHLA
jgi:tetratricopeptide (TPR) repeat protein